MSSDMLEQIVDSLMYEGYILYPYRRSSRKNQRERFTFGRIYPEAFAEVQDGREPCLMQTQCLVRGTAATVAVRIQFLQPVLRGASAWLEAVERQVNAPPQSVAGRRIRVPFRFDPCEGAIEIRTERVMEKVTRVTVRILNTTPLGPDSLADTTAVLLRTFASTHTVLQVWDGEFISMLEPPDRYAAAAAGCANIGTWPVLIGDRAGPDADTMLSSPIVLYDYPVVAAESPGDWCDATEIDEMLALRVQAMTDEEKAEVREVDAYARRILERTENLSQDAMLQLHGTMREAGTAPSGIFDSAPPLSRVTIGAMQLKAGDFVRIVPKGRADVMDKILAGRTAVLESIEQDAEGKIHLALVVQDDPGRDLGMMRQVGHRFFYGIDEVEPLAGSEV